MIVNIRGTHGSGKSTIVRKVLDRCLDLNPQFIAGKKRPTGYYSEGMNLWVPGHYETPCGGCDSISIVDDAYASVSNHAGVGQDVLFEGILAQHSTRNALGLYQAFRSSFRIIVLTTPLEECIASVNARRAAKGRGPLDPPDSITGEFKAVRSAMSRLRDAGVNVMEASRDETFELTLSLLRIP